MVDANEYYVLDNDSFSGSSLNSYSSLSSYSDQSSYSSSLPLATKFNLMFWVFAEGLLLTLFGLRCIEKGNKASRIMAILGLVVGAVALLLQLGLIWEIVPAVEVRGFFSYNLTVMAKITILATIASFMLVGGALIMRIEENEKNIRLLKMCAVICGAGEWITIAIMIFNADSQSLIKLVGVSGILSACCMVCWITALVLSRFNKNDKENGEIKSGEKKNVDEGEAIMGERELKEDKVNSVEMDSQKQNVATDESIQSNNVTEVQEQPAETSAPSLQSDTMPTSFSSGVKLDVSMTDNPIVSEQPSAANNDVQVASGGVQMADGGPQAQ